MENGQLNWIANFIWGIADDVLRDVYVRGKHRDVILPMVVIRRLDAVLEPTKDAALKMKVNPDNAKVAADRAHQNAVKDSGKPNARIEHDKALDRVMTELIADHTELFKQFGDNPGFKKWLSDTIFGVTYTSGAA